MGLFDDVVDFAKKTVSGVMAQGESSLGVRGLSSIIFTPDSQPGVPKEVHPILKKGFERVLGGALAMRKDYLHANDYRAARRIALDPKDKPFGPMPVSNAFGDLLLYAMGAASLSKPPQGVALNLSRFSFPVVGTKYIQRSETERENTALHENVHIGQYKYGVKNIPSLEETDKYVFKKPGESQQFLEENYGPIAFSALKPLELGATLLARNPIYYREPTAEHIGNYLDLLYRRNPEKAAILEAYVPPYVMKQYIQDRPRPLLPPAHRQILSSNLENR